ncbi:uncharacterized protein LOC144700802 isoform X2 [Wolffia australiana]
MEGNEMSASFEQRLFDRRMGLGGVGRMGCTLVTGFLGGGKTTLLRHVVRHRGDLRVAIVVNEFAEFDVDSVILDSERLNKAYNLPPASFSLGCGNGDVMGTFRNILRGIIDSKQNFDCLIVETSGLARPDHFVATLEEFGVHLDMTVAVVDAESLDKVIKLDIAQKQLQHVDLILLNKCDLASLGQISDAEDALESLSGGARVVRCQFCRVPLEIIIDCSKTESLTITKKETANISFLSHESFSKPTFQDVVIDYVCNGVSSPASVNNLPKLKEEASEELKTVLSMMKYSVGLIRAKGVLWFADDRDRRYIFQWSGVKRVEAVSSGRWEVAPGSRLVMIGVDQSELVAILEMLQTLPDHPKSIPFEISCKRYSEILASRISNDGRFKEPCLEKMPLIVFGLKGSPLRGVQESQLNGALMQAINGRWVIFLTADSTHQDYQLQYLPSLALDPDDVWNEIRMVASQVIAKLCKNFCICRCELAAHVH